MLPDLYYCPLLKHPVKPLPDWHYYPVCKHCLDENPPLCHWNPRGVPNIAYHYSANSVVIQILSKKLRRQIKRVRRYSAYGDAKLEKRDIDLDAEKQAMLGIAKSLNFHTRHNAGLLSVHLKTHPLTLHERRFKRR